MIDRFAVIIGGMRCGTTSLYHLLAQHPEIAPCVDKEPAFFSNDESWSRGRAYYESLWEFDPIRHSIALEASTNYYKTHMFPDVAARMAAFGSEFRIIFSVRDPLERIESHYILGAAKGWPESARPLSEGVHPEFISCSRYATTLDVFRRHLPADSILLVNFADFRREPAAVLEAICGFVGVSPGFRFERLDVAHNTNVGRRPGDLGQRLYRFRKYIPFWIWLARRLPQQRIDRIRKLFARETREASLLGEDQRQTILRELGGELRRLEVEFGVDLSGWRCMSSVAGDEGAQRHEVRG